jgi:ankyrin repeat protein
MVSVSPSTIPRKSLTHDVAVLKKRLSMRMRTKRHLKSGSLPLRARLPPIDPFPLFIFSGTLLVALYLERPFMNFQEEFLESVKSGDLTKVRALLKSDPLLLQSRNEIGLSPIMLAIYRFQKEMVDLLLSCQPDLDLFESAAVGKWERVQALIQQDPTQINAVSPDGFSPLGLAAFFGHPKVVAYLIEHGADVNAPSKNPMRVCPLHSALAHRQAEVAFEIAKRLVAHGADVNATQAGGWTPLHQAAMHGLVEVATLLLDHGADLDAKAENGKSPLELATIGKHKEMVALLRERGAA